MSLAFVSFVLMTNSVSIAGHMRSGKKLRKFMLTVCTVLFECTIWSIVGKMRNVIDKCIYSILLYYRG